MYDIFEAHRRCRGTMAIVIPMIPVAAGSQNLADNLNPMVPRYVIPSLAMRSEELAKL